MLKLWFGTTLWKRVACALVLGTLIGLAWGPNAVAIKWIGELFIRSIKMLVVPLIFFSIASGVAALEDLRKLGSVGGKVLALFGATGVISVTLGLTLGAIFEPGVGLDVSSVGRGAMPDLGAISLAQALVSLVPENPVMAMAEGQMLPTIIFALLFGIALLMAGDDAGPMVRGIESGAAAMHRMTTLVMELTPFGVFALMAWVSGTFGWSALLPLAALVVLNYVGCLILVIVIYSAMLKVIARLSAFDFFRGIVDAQSIAFSTASSNAAMPVTLQCAQRNLGVSKSVASFTIGLGTTINMNGTAMFLGLAALFGAQIHGVELSWSSYLMIGLTAILSSVSAAGIPGTGLIMMGLVLSSVGIPLDTIAIVAGVNHLMDMMRTMTNVTGNAAVAVIVAKLSNEIAVEEYLATDEI